MHLERLTGRCQGARDRRHHQQIVKRVAFDDHEDDGTAQEQRGGADAQETSRAAPTDPVPDGAEGQDDTRQHGQPCGEVRHGGGDRQSKRGDDQRQSGGRPDSANGHLANPSPVTAHVSRAALTGRMLGSDRNARIT